MVVNQHTLITGYRDLTQPEIDLINRIKQVGVELHSLVDNLHSETDVVIDRRWLAIGITDLQTGLMALTRAVAKPESF